MTEKLGFAYESNGRPREGALASAGDPRIAGELSDAHRKVMDALHAQFSRLETVASW